MPALLGGDGVLVDRGIKSVDPVTLLTVSLMLTAVGMAACYVPARRATKVDPMLA